MRSLLRAATFTLRKKIDRSARKDEGWLRSFTEPRSGPSSPVQTAAMLAVFGRLFFYQAPTLPQKDRPAAFAGRFLFVLDDEQGTNIHAPKPLLVREGIMPLYATRARKAGASVILTPNGVLLAGGNDLSCMADSLRW
jgi:hypothetical protein